MAAHDVAVVEPLEDRHLQPDRLEVVGRQVRRDRDHLGVVVVAVVVVAVIAAAVAAVVVVVAAVVVVVVVVASVIATRSDGQRRPIV